MPIQLRQEEHVQDITISQKETTEIVHTGTASWVVQLDEKQSFSGILDVKDLEISHLQVGSFVLHICTLFKNSLITLLKCNELSNKWRTLSLCLLFMLYFPSLKSSVI